MKCKCSELIAGFGLFSIIGSFIHRRRRVSSSKIERGLNNNKGKYLIKNEGK